MDSFDAMLLEPPVVKANIMDFGIRLVNGKAQQSPIFAKQFSKKLELQVNNRRMAPIYLS
jgi:hypothetical protein